MQFLLLVLDRRDKPPRAAVSDQEMAKFAAELASEGVLRDGGPLRPEAEGTRVRVRNGVASAVAGGQTAAGEILVGYFDIEVADREAAIEIAKRCPHARAGLVDVRRAHGRRLPGKGKGPRFVHLYLWGPELTGPDEPRMAEMGAFMGQIAGEGVLVAGARLPPDEPATRVEVTGGETLVTDGPFAETKEIIAGFSLIEAGRAESLEVAKRTPHAKWDSVIVREVDLAMMGRK